MRFIVKQNSDITEELQFADGPVRIGRQSGSQIILRDKAVSRQHAVILKADDGKWMVEDLDSASKTYLNDQVIHKAEIKTGDCLRITDFTIEIELENDNDADEPVQAEDTFVKALLESQIIVRKPDAESAPPVRFPAKRIMNFFQAIETIGKVENPDELVLALLDILFKQFGALTCWCALRNQPAGPMTCHAGRKRDGQTVELSDIKLNEKIIEAIDRKQFLLFLFSREPGQVQKGKIRSVLIAPVLGPADCFGVIYVDNAIGDEHYSLNDLDYLMLLGIHTATILKRF